MLDSNKTWHRKVVEAETADAAAGRDKLKDLENEQRQAAQRLIEDERRKRSHIVAKYLDGMQVKRHQQQQQRSSDVSNLISFSSCCCCCCCWSPFGP